MRISTEQLTHLPVETASGTELGHIKNLILDTDSQSVLQYEVRPSGIVGSLIGDSLLIDRGSVRAITAEKIVVDDSVAAQDEKARESKKPQNKEAPAGVMQSVEDK